MRNVPWFAATKNKRGVRNRCASEDKAGVMRGPKNDQWTNRQRKWWHDLIEHLREELPAERPIRVTRSSTQGYPGGVEDHNPQRFAICISADRVPWEARYDLAEEWAHVLAGWCGDELADHGLAWGMAYSTVRREIIVFEHETGAPPTR